MIINSIKINKFRGFSNVQFELGEKLTVIAGQNGTQKTTLLGILTQPFSITEKENPISGETPLCGGNYRSSFAEKFKLSDTFDKPQKHEWTLKLNNTTDSEFTLESIRRDSSSDAIRFWRKGSRAKGSGYLQYPVIYLSLSRLFPIGEDLGINSSSDISLSNEEFEFYKKWHDKILIMPVSQMTRVDYLKSKQKNTLGFNTSYYDWKMNSAGQDNIGKILLAILSFKRLKENHKDFYNGGILAIDELDATLYPGSQLKLIDALRKFSSDFKLQIIFTTHSLTILEQMCKLQEDRHFSKQIKVIYLDKKDNNVNVNINISFEDIQNNLNVTLLSKQKVKKTLVFVEDKEGEFFAKAILKRRTSSLQFVNCSMGCNNYLELVKKNVPGFKYKQSIIILDGDVKNENSSMKKLKNYKHILLLPGTKSPERLLAEYLYNLPESSDLWEKISNNYRKQLVFSDYSINEIVEDRTKAKKWFNNQKEYWGRGCIKVINLWVQDNKDDVNSFINEYEKLVKGYI